MCSVSVISELGIMWGIKGSEGVFVFLRVTWKVNGRDGILCSSGVSSYL